jgi:dihydropteroate synthase type 2
VIDTPKIVAILNVTEDSFSDGGRFLSATAALRQAQALIRDGADVLELGPASSHPDAKPVAADVQIERLRPVLAELQDAAIPLSIDATDPEVLRFGIDVKAAYLNDIRGFPDPSLYAELASSRASLVVVHSLLGQATATRDAATVDEVLASIDRFFEHRLADLVRAGISEDRLIVDPGMGFFLGSDERASLAVLRGIEDLRRRFGRPVFVSVSRKSFLRKVTGSPIAEIAAATLAAELYAAAHGVDYLRTHDPAALRDGLAVHRALA